jgi:hypothetical protein
VTDATGLVNPGDGLAFADHLLSVPNPRTGCPFDPEKGLDEVLRMASEAGEVIALHPEAFPPPVLRVVHLLTMAVASLGVAVRGQTRDATAEAGCERRDA